MLRHVITMGILVGMIWFNIGWIIAATKRNAANSRVLLVLALTSLYVVFTVIVAVQLAMAAIQNR